MFGPFAVFCAALALGWAATDGVDGVPEEQSTQAQDQDVAASTEQLRSWFEQLEQHPAIKFFADFGTPATDKAKPNDADGSEKAPAGEIEGTTPPSVLDAWTSGLPSYSTWFKPIVLPWEVKCRIAIISWHQFANQDAMRGARLPKAIAPAADIALSAIEDKEIRLPVNIVYIRISKPILDRYFSRHVDRQRRVRDNILGSEVFGRARTIAETKLKLQPSETKAQAELSLVGSNHYESTSYQDPVQISSKGETKFESRKVIEIDGDGIHQEKPKTTAVSKTTTTGISSSLPGLRGRIAQQVATRREAESHAEAEKITAEHTRAIITEDFDKWVVEEMANFTATFKAQLGRLAELQYGNDFALDKVQCSTTSDLLQLVLYARSVGDPYYIDPPTPSPDRPEIEIQIHTGLMKKAFVDPQFRETVQSVVDQLVTRKAFAMIKNSKDSDNPPDFDVKWSGDLNWMMLTWHIKAPSVATRAEPVGAKKLPPAGKR